MAKNPINGMVLNNAGDWEFYLDGKSVAEAEYRKVFPLPKERPGAIVGGTPTRGWPMKSVALAVHPDQVAEANERNRAHGVNVSYEPTTGNAIIPDRPTRRRLLKLERFHDKDGGYGDG